MIIHEWFAITRREGTMHKQCSTDGNLSTYITSMSIINIGNSITINIIYQICITVRVIIHQRECYHVFMIQYGWKIHASAMQWRKSVHAPMIQHRQNFLYIYTQVRVSLILLIQSQNMVTVTMTICVTAGNWPTLIVRICSYSVLYVVYILIST